MRHKEHFDSVFRKPGETGVSDFFLSPFSPPTLTYVRVGTLQIQGQGFHSLPFYPLGRSDSDLPTSECSLRGFGLEPYAGRDGRDPTYSGSGVEAAKYLHEVAACLPA